MWTAELMAHTGYDSLTIDMQHGMIDYQLAAGMLQAISATDTVPIVRVPWNEPWLIMKILDAGAYGVICPMVNTRVEAEAFVGACRFMPAGYRSYGSTRAPLYAGEDYVYHANETIITLAMIETAQALKNLDEITSTPGLTGLYIGPADLSISLGLPEIGNFQDPVLMDALEQALAAARCYNKVAGIQANTPENAIMLANLGFRFVTSSHDSILLRTGAKEYLTLTQQGLKRAK
jgi:4-hydroxy-2-oxoheptanedioate aldolase